METIFVSPVSQSQFQFQRLLSRPKLISHSPTLDSLHIAVITHQPFQPPPSTSLKFRTKEELLGSGIHCSNLFSRIHHQANGESMKDLLDPLWCAHGFPWSHQRFFGFSQLPCTSHVQSTKKIVIESQQQPNNPNPNPGGYEAYKKRDVSTRGQ
ncbi:uncharacterized protein LOC127259130 [Andrographis paniculata]|uniref:uncharacterized protein LOC127259130 n=1 Tax=Andrographis paniculata TaxID=175694 RepID=UPI0021E8393B|nr:uncharacterized protein LOC127259130 [Andrographis paniculata]